MGSSSLPTWFRGLILPDPRWTADAFDAINSVYTEGGPQPGEVTLLDDSNLVVDAVGSIEATTDILGKTVRGGHPGTARHVWKREGDSLWKGWGPPVNPTGFRFVDRSTTADKWHPRHIAKLTDGTVLTVAVKDLRQIVVHIYDADTGAPTEVEVYDPGSAASYDTQPCLLVLPSGRVLCFFWRESGTNSDVRMYYSDDDGATWLPGQKGALPLPYVTASYAPGRLRAAFIRGQVCLVAGLQYVAGPTDWLVQFASLDLGANFTLISTLSGVSRAFHDLLEVDGQLLLTYISTPGGGYAATHLPYYRKVSGAYESLADADANIISDVSDTMEWGTLAGGVYTAGEMALWRDDDGVIYVAGVDHDTAGGAFYEVMVRRSKDGGSTWDWIGYGAAGSVVASGIPTYTANDTATYLKDLSAIAVRGRTWMVCRHEANPGTGDDSIGILYLGGYTSVEPAQYLAEVRDEPDWITGYVNTYLPLDYPENTGGVWTASTSTGTTSLTALGLRFVTGGGQAEIRTTGTLAGTLAEGIEVCFEVRIESGTGRCNLRISDATPLEYEVSALISTTAVVFYDNKAAANIASVTTSAANGAHIQVKIAISTASAKMWYRTVGTHAPNPVQDWVLVGSSTTLTSAAVNTGSKVIFGQDANSDTYWRLVAFSHDQYTGVGIVTQTNWGDLIGRGYSSRPVYITDGTSIQTARGPTYRNEDWQILPRPDYPVSNVHTPSPREPWESEPAVGYTDGSNVTQVDLEWELGGKTYVLGSVLAIYLGGCNFGTAQLWGKDNAGTWQNLGTLDMRVQTGLKFTRDHRLVTADLTGGASCSTAFPVDILAGSHLALPFAGEGHVVRPIEANSSGVWVSGATSQPVRILLETVTGTESTSGTTAEVWLKDAAFLRPITAVYSAFRIRIPAQRAYGGKFRIGAMNLGSFHQFGHEYGWGRGIETTPIYEMTEGRTAIRRARKLAPPRRAVEFDFTDGIDSGAGTANNPDPSWVQGWTGATYTGAISIPSLTGYDLRGVMHRQSGAVVPVTYVGAVSPPGSSTAVVRVINRELLLHGRIATETLRGDNAVGSEWLDEVHRWSTVRIEEEP